MKRSPGSLRGSPWAVPMVSAGDDLPSLIADAVLHAGRLLHDGDVVVIAQKIVSKSEGRTVDPRRRDATPEAIVLAADVGKESAPCPVVLSEIGACRAQPAER